MATQARSSARFLSRAGPLIAARLTGAAFTFFIPLVLARALSLDDYGTWKQFFLVAGTLSLLAPFGVAQGLYFFVPRSTAHRGHVGNALLYSLVAGAAVGVGLVALGGAVARWLGNPALVPLLPALGVYTAALIAAYPLEITLTARGESHLAALSWFVGDTTRAAVVLIPALLGAGLPFVVTLLAGHAVLRALGAWIFLALRNGLSFSRSDFSAQLRYALPFGLAMVLEVLQGNLHQYVVGHFVPPALFALYAVGCFQIPAVEMLQTPTSEVLMVRLAELERSGDLSAAPLAFRAVVSRLAWLFFPLAAFLITVAPQFVAALFGPKFADAAPLLRLSASLILLEVFPVDAVLRARGRTRALFAAYALKAALVLPLVIVGLRQAGLAGALLGSVTAEWLGKALLLSRVPAALSPKEGRIRLGGLVCASDLLRPACTSATAAAATALLLRAGGGLEGSLPSGGAWRFLPLAAAGAVFAAAYAASLFCAGVRPAALLAPLRRERPMDEASSQAA